MSDHILISPLLSHCRTALCRGTHGCSQSRQNLFTELLLSILNNVFAAPCAPRAVFTACRSDLALCPGSSQALFSSCLSCVHWDAVSVLLSLSCPQLSPGLVPQRTCSKGHVCSESSAGPGAAEVSLVSAGFCVCPLTGVSGTVGHQACSALRVVRVKYMCVCVYIHTYTCLYIFKSEAENGQIVILLSPDNMKRHVSQQSSLPVFQIAAFRSMDLWEHFNKLQKDPFNRGKREFFSLNIFLGETQAISAKMRV